MEKLRKSEEEVRSARMGCGDVAPWKSWEILTKPKYGKNEIQPFKVGWSSTWDGMEVPRSFWLKHHFLGGLNH